MAQRVVVDRLPLDRYASEMVSYWLAKSEPYKYAYSQLEKEKRTIWDGVRNHEARNNLRAMKKGDLVCFYHSNEGKEIVGIAKVIKEAYHDPTTDEDWSVVELGPVAALKVPVTLATIKADPAFAKMEMLRRSRLSVTHVSAAEFKAILKLGQISL
jgi:predicted RNA-binding protein with PUA-like domain